LFVCLLGFADREPSSLGIPSDTQYMEEYCKRAGIPAVKNWNFYMAFSFFRVAAILQGVYKRGLQGIALENGIYILSRNSYLPTDVYAPSKKLKANLYSRVIFTFLRE